MTPLLVLGLCLLALAGLIALAALTLQIGRRDDARNRPLHTAQLAEHARLHNVAPTDRSARSPRE